jgi:hypothetical protein
VIRITRTRASGELVAASLNRDGDDDSGLVPGERARRSDGSRRGGHEPRTNAPDVAQAGEREGVGRDLIDRFTLFAPGFKSRI